MTFNNIDFNAKRIIFAQNIVSTHFMTLSRLQDIV